jgi:hypothetical protein
MIRKVMYLVVVGVLLLGLTVIPVQAATPEDIEASIEAGLAWLVGVGQDMDPLSPYYGSWEGAGSREAGTGLALYKLCDRAYELGYESPFDPEYEYSGNVTLGFTWLFNHLLIVPVSIQDHTSGATGTLDDPDTRVNGKGVMGTGVYESYHTGIMLTAIAASGTPDRTNEGGLDVDGDVVVDTYQEIAQDMVDFLAFAQVDPSVNWDGDMQEGGWDYVAVDNGAGGSGWQGDQSNSGYVVLGLAEAEAFGCTVPDWVKTELNWWIDWVQDDVTGGSCYSYPNDGVGMNILKTGNLLLEMRFVGDTPDTPRVVDALAYLSSNWTNPAGWWPDNGWKSGNPGVVASDYQTMFCIMKGLEYMGIPPDGIPGVADWYMDFADAIIAEQDNATGKWLLPGNWEGSDENVINAEWALLTLEKIAPPSTPIEVTKDYRYTNVCFEKDNDLDGLFNEDPIDFDGEGNPIDNDGDDLYNEDPVDCPMGTYLGDELPMDDNNYVLEAVIHPRNNKVLRYNPGQYYAVSTVNVIIDVEVLTIEEDWSDCCNISVLNPPSGGGSVVIVQVGPGDAVAYQIFDAMSDAIAVNATACTATATLEDVAAGTIIYMYVKFGPALKGQPWVGPYGPCVNYNRASVVEEPTVPEDWIEASANLTLVVKD